MTVACPGVKGIEQPFHLEVRKRQLIGETARKERAPVAYRCQLADDLDARTGQGIELQGGMLGRSDKLRRRQSPGALEILDLIVALIPYPGVLHPPEYVAAPVGSR